MLCRKLFVALIFATLAIAHAEETQVQTELPSGARVRLGTLQFLGGSSASAMAFSPDGKTIIWQGVDYGSNFTVRHWDLAQGDCAMLGNLRESGNGASGWRMTW